MIVRFNSPFFWQIFISPFCTLSQCKAWSLVSSRYFMMMASNTGEHGMCTVKRYLDIKVSHDGKELPKFFHITLCPLKDMNIDFKKYSVFFTVPLNAS